jgi:hypothetical protein
MTDATDHKEEQPSKRGEAAWKAAKERVAERNAQARKAGKQRREVYERQRAEARRQAERREIAAVLEKDLSTIRPEDDRPKPLL